jgi:acetyl-CoA carboxylase biotin carboxylase subunit
MFKRILIANRGEIALRVIRACRELGVETVAIFSEADRGAPYLELADEAICVGPARAADSYLRIDRVISAAEIGNVQAIHPGYGFLSENSHFAEVCRSCDIGFIGPTPEAMERVGDKNSARALAREAGVPTVPGSDGLVASDDDAVRIAREIGFRCSSRPRPAAAARGCGWPPTTCPWPRPGSRPPPRPRPPSAMPASTSRNTSSGRGTWRSRSSATATATCSTSGSATAPRSGGTKN